MSSGKIQVFLQQKEQERIKQKEMERFKILSRYRLGELVYFKEGDVADEFPLSFPKDKRKFKYECDISEEDFEKV